MKCNADAYVVDCMLYINLLMKCKFMYLASQILAHDTERISEMSTNNLFRFSPKQAILQYTIPFL